MSPGKSRIAGSGSRARNAIAVLLVLSWILVPDAPIPITLPSAASWVNPPLPVTDHGWMLNDSATSRGQDMSGATASVPPATVPENALELVADSFTENVGQ